MKGKIIIAFLLVLKFLLPFLLPNSVFELHRDEYLYYEQGHHLSLGYLENPPLIGWMAAISSLFGGGFFWIKIWPALFGAATLFVTVQLVKEFGGGLFAQLIAALGILFSTYLRIHFLFQPNFLDIFFWTLGAYFLVRYLNTKRNAYIYWLAFALVVGWYGKYSVLFFILALFGSLLLTQNRVIFLKKTFWLALIGSLLLIAPNLIWQYLHNWPLVHHMKELQETQLQYVNKADFIKEQLLMLLPVVFVWIGGLVWLLRSSVYRVIGYCYLLIILLLMLGSGKGYYALGAYPMLLAAGGVWAERISINRAWLRYAFVLLILIVSLPFVPLLLPISSPQKMEAANKKWGWEKLGILKWEDGKNHALQQDFADMLGWKEITQKTEHFFNSLPDSTKASTIVFGSNYGLAGSMKYYAATRSFQDKIISTNGTFLLWMPDNLAFTNMLFVTEKIRTEPLFQLFQNATIVDSCTNALSRQYGVKIIYYRGLSLEGKHRFQQFIQKQKAEFSR